MPTLITRTLRPSGGDFTTMAAWISTLPADLVAADEAWTLECYNFPGGLSEQGVVLPALITDATRNITIKTAGDGVHNGIPGAGYFSTGSTFSAVGLTIQCDNVIVDGIEIIATGSSGSASPLTITNTADNVVVQNSIFSRDFRTTGYCASAGTNGPTSHEFRKCLFLGGNRGGNFFFKANVKNCVFANNATGFYDSGSSYAKIIENCAAFNNSTAGLRFLASATSNNNASEDLTATGPGSITGITSADFVDTANDDYHLSAGSSLIGQGVNLSGDFTTDIDGDTWPGAGAWNIGFDFLGVSNTELTTLFYSSTELITALDITQPSNVELTSSYINTSSLNADLSSLLPFNTLIEGSSELTAEVSGSLPLSSTIVSSSELNSLLDLTTQNIELTSIIQSNSVLFSNLDGRVFLSGTFYTLSEFTSTLSITQSLTGEISNSSSLNGNIGYGVDLAATIYASTTLLSEFQFGQPLSTVITVSSALNSDLSTSAALTSLIENTSELNADLTTTTPNVELTGFYYGSSDLVADISTSLLLTSEIDSRSELNGLLDYGIDGLTVSIENRSELLSSLSTALGISSCYTASSSFTSLLSITQTLNFLTAEIKNKATFGANLGLRVPLSVGLYCRTEFLSLLSFLLPTTELGTITYVTVPDAELYFADTLGSEAWFAASEVDKDKALVTASQRISLEVKDTCKLPFTPPLTNESLQFAVYQLALAFLTDSSLLDNTSSGKEVKRAKAGSAEVEFFSGNGKTGTKSRFPRNVMDLLIKAGCIDKALLCPPIATGLCGESTFDKPDNHEKTKGFY